MNENFRVKAKDGSRYSLRAATLISRRGFNDVWDWDQDNNTSPSCLYRTKDGEYFETFEDPDTGKDVVISLSIDDAIHIFEDPTNEPLMSFQLAFPTMRA